MNTLICEYCNKEYSLTDKELKDRKGRFCSLPCAQQGQRKEISQPCGQCGSLVTRVFKEVNKSKSGHIFCDHTCAARYNNTHKTTGTNRSKLEVWLEQKLPKEFPDLTFKFNSKEEINSELDIYIPSLKLAFELNGIFHYEPIFGDDKLSQIQSNDQNKFQLCQANGISLCIIDTSSQKYFTEKSSLKYLEIIKNVIKSRS